MECKSSKSTQSVTQELGKLSIGTGGGVAGLKDQYQLGGDGKVSRLKGPANAKPEATPGKAIPADQVAEIFKQCKALKWDQYKQLKPGNTYQFIEWTQGNTKQYVAWDSAKLSEVPQELLSFYKNTFEKLKN